MIKLNACFLMGKVQTEIDFKFIMNGKHDAIAVFYIGLMNQNHCIKVLAYDRRADYCLRKLQKGDIVFIEGCLTNRNHKINVMVHHVYKNEEAKENLEKNR